MSTEPFPLFTRFDSIESRSRQGHERFRHKLIDRFSCFAFFFKDIMCVLRAAMAVDTSARPEASGAALLGGAAAVLTATAGMGADAAPVASGAMALNGVLIGATFGNGRALQRQSWLAGAIFLLSAIRSESDMAGAIRGG